MFKPTFLNRIEKRTQLYLQPALAPIRRKQLVSNDFSIISNNCWGGMVYEWYGLEKKSPTVGLFFFADDYLKFIGNLKYYLSLEIEMRSAKESRRFDRLVAYQSEEAPIGVLDNDIEIVMLHYKDPVIAKDKWERRRKRVNFNNLVIKFSYMNDCNLGMLHVFDNMLFDGFSPKKIMFINKPDLSLKSGVYMPGFENDDQISNDTYFFNKYLKLTKFINTGVIVQKHNNQRG